MPRPSRNEDFPVLDLDTLFPLPPEKVGSGFNIDYFRCQFKRLNALYQHHMRYGQLLPNYKQALDGLKEEAKLAGFDPDALADTRTDAQIAESFLLQLRDMPDAAMQAAEREISAVEKTCDEAIALCHRRLSALVGKAEKEGVGAYTAAELEALVSKGKSIRSLLNRARALRQRIVSPKSALEREKKRLKEIHSHISGFYLEAIEAARPLLFMLYVGRSDTSDLGADGTSVFRIARHHARMCVAYWLARNGVHIHKEGFQFEAFPYEGLVLVLPPRHGKTALGMHILGLEICDHPQLQTIFLHNSSDLAEKSCQQVSKMFDITTETGRRRAAIFGHMPLSKRDNNASSMRLAAADKNRDPTISANGVGDKRSGANADFLFIDDPVDQEQAKSDAERIATINRINGTWLARRQGYKSFVLWLSTLWHDDDATGRIIRQSYDGDAKFKVVLMGAGGPEEHFRPVWPDSPYGSEFLRSAFKRMGPREYMTIYGCRPSQGEAALVKKIALYPTHLPNGSPTQEHADFLKGAFRWVSIDPAATASKTSDRAGILYCGVGQLETRDTDSNGNSRTEHRKRLRILQASNTRATPGQVVEKIAGLALNSRVDSILIETVGAFSMLADDIRRTLGVKVETFRPGGGRSKEVRLKDCHLMIDASQREAGINPVVEFPGVWSKRGAGCTDHNGSDLVIEGERALCKVCGKEVDYLRPADGVKWLVDEILRFGSHPTDDGVDALTQLCILLRADFGLDAGVASSVISRRMGQRVEAIATMIAENRASLDRPDPNPGQSDYNWYADSSAEGAMSAY